MEPLEITCIGEAPLGTLTDNNYLWTLDNATHVEETFEELLAWFSASQKHIPCRYSVRHSDLSH